LTIIRKFFLVVIFFFIFSCSKNDSDLVDIDSFFKDGKKIDLINHKNHFNTNVSKIKNLKISSRDVFLNWNQENYNIQNLIGPSGINIFKKKTITAGKFKKIVSYQNKLIVITNTSEVQIYNQDLKKILTKKIYQKKIYKKFNIDHSVIVYKNKIFISDSLGAIFCLSIDDLKIIWKKNLSVPFKSDIKIYKDNIYLINSNSKLYSIDSRNGKINWSFETASNSIKSKSSYQIAIFDNNLYFTNDNAEIFCLNLDKKKITWSLTFETPAFKKVPLVFKSSPILIDDSENLIISTNYGYTYNINARTGSINWSKEIFSLNRFISTKKYLFFFNLNRLFIIDKRIGEIVYNNKININHKKELFFKDLIIGKNNIYLFNTKGFYLSINLENFNSYSLNKFTHGYKSLLISKNNLFILSNSVIAKY